MLRMILFQFGCIQFPFCLGITPIALVQYDFRSIIFHTHLFVFMNEPHILKECE